MYLGNSSFVYNRLQFGEQGMALLRQRLIQGIFPAYHKVLIFRRSLGGVGLSVGLPDSQVGIRC